MQAFVIYMQDVRRFIVRRTKAPAYKPWKSVVFQTLVLRKVLAASQVAILTRRIRFQICDCHTFCKSIEKEIWDLKVECRERENLDSRILILKSQTYNIKVLVEVLDRIEIEFQDLRLSRTYEARVSPAQGDSPNLLSLWSYVTVK